MPSPCGTASIDAISLGGKQISQISPGSSIESSTGIATFLLLMTVAKRRLLQWDQNIVVDWDLVVLLPTHAYWLMRTNIRGYRPGCMGICTGICMLLCSSGGPAWPASVRPEKPWLKLVNYKRGRQALKLDIKPRKKREKGERWELMGGNKHLRDLIPKCQWFSYAHILW